MRSLILTEALERPRKVINKNSDIGKAKMKSSVHRASEEAKIR